MCIIISLIVHVDLISKYPLTSYIVLIVNLLMSFSILSGPQEQYKKFQEKIEV